MFNDYRKSFPRFEKYTLGEKIQDLITKLLITILKSAYISRDEKLLLLKEADNQLFIIKTLIRLIQEIKLIDFKKYIHLEEKLQEIGRMLGGWIKSID